MALAVASTSTASAADSNTLNITAPTGIQSGDLLLIALVAPNLATPTSTGFTISASKQQNNSGALPDVTVSLLYKIATVADESTGTYTVDDNQGAASMGVASMLRVTGWGTTDPVYTSASTGGAADPVTGISVTGLTLARPGQQLLLMLTGFRSMSSLGARSVFSSSGYTITSSDSNPTWTELQDTYQVIYSNTDNLGFSLAYALSSDTSTITGFSNTITSDSNGDSDGYASLLAVLVAPTSATPTSSTITLPPPTIAASPAANSTQATSTNLDNPAISIQASSTTSTSNPWSNEAQTSDTWVNETI